ncbi:MAG: cytidylate kinase-like family protein, partial [Oscillospiraceae bacterium]|nr:cytidylate kinase-like family protein [Oscillospiraceae bacterium]
IVEEMFERADEKPTDSFLYSLSMGQGTQNISLLMHNEYLSNDNLFVIQANAIKEIAAEHSCIMIGRCADYILSDVCDVVSVFIHADKDYRIKRICKTEGLKESDAATKVRKTDKKRANYYNFYAEEAWGVASTYDLCLNSGKLGIDGCVAMITAYLQQRKKQE